MPWYSTDSKINQQAELTILSWKLSKLNHALSLTLPYVLPDHGC